MANFRETIAVIDVRATNHFIAAWSIGASPCAEELTERQPCGKPLWK
jgi:hypothetical protein